MRTKRVWIQGDRLRLVERLVPGLLANGGPRAASALMREMLPPCSSRPEKAPDPEQTYRVIDHADGLVVFDPGGGMPVKVLGGLRPADWPLGTVVRFDPPAR